MSLTSDEKCSARELDRDKEALKRFLKERLSALIDRYGEVRKRETLVLDVDRCLRNHLDLLVREVAPVAAGERPPPADVLPWLTLLVRGHTRLSGLTLRALTELGDDLRALDDERRALTELERLRVVRELCGE